MFVPNVSPLKINSYRFNTNSANEKNNYELLSKYVNNSVKITFTGSNRNPNQIAVMSAECGPYAVIGGLGTVTRDMTKAYKIAYPHKDIRIFLPFYNSEYNGARNLDGKNTFYTSEIRDGKKINGTPYQVEDTGIETDFSYGVKKSKAKLFKISNPENGVTTYLVQIPEFKQFTKPYASTYLNMVKMYSAFSFATTKLLEKMCGTKENFNPKILHTNDWHTAFATIANDDKDLKTIHELSNAGIQGKIKPVDAMLFVFNDSQISRLLKDKDFIDGLYKLAIENKNYLLKNVYVRDLNEEIKHPEVSRKILENLFENFEPVFEKPANKPIKDKINHAIKMVFTDINWDENQDYNPTVIGVNAADAWFTTSRTHFKELISDPKNSNKSLYNMLRLNLNKGTGILQRIDSSAYNPSSPDCIKYPFSINNFKDGKAQNKEYLFKRFSKENIKRKGFSKRLLQNPNKATIVGSLDKHYINSPLFVCISRFDTYQKGCDIALDAIERALRKHKNATFIIGYPGIKTSKSGKYEDFIKKVINKPENKGRVVLIDDFLPINSYLAGADFSIIPSRSETCGLVGYQSMRMGAVPIATPVGSMNDELITAEQDYTRAMGYKMPASFKDFPKPYLLLYNAIERAKFIYDNDKKLHNNMIKNAMAYDSDWKIGIADQDELYRKVANDEKINNLTLNDLRAPEDVVNISMYNEHDIDKLKKADVLVVLPHSDDEIFFLPMLKYIDAGKSVQVIYSQANDKGHYKEGAPSTPAEMAKHREQEALASLFALGITRNPLKLNIPDVKLSLGDNPRLATEYLTQILDKVQPQVVLSYGPEGTTGNPDHKKLGELVFKTVANRRKATGEDIKLYQMAFEENNAEALKKIMETGYTDSFYFVKGVPASQIKGTDDITHHIPRIRKSLEQHKSQWHKQEVDGFLKYYGQYGAAYTELKDYPEIGIPNHPWIDSRNEFSNKYGKEFSIIKKDYPQTQEEREAGTVVYQPENSRQVLEVKLPKDNMHRRILLLTDKQVGLTDLAQSEKVPEILFDSIAKFKKIPQFKDIEKIALIINPINGSQKLRVFIPLDEAKEVAPYLKNLMIKGRKGLDEYLINNPKSLIVIK